ncbi:MAG: rane protein of unknown function [Candidatus Saccharibacteria bacterium]|nr:rane protein of unknown function [Candidatus Saccharibacteria bacterium]
MKNRQLRHLVIIGALIVSAFGLFASSQNAFADNSTQAGCVAAGGTWSTVNSGPGGQGTTGTCTPKDTKAASNMTPINQIKSYSYYAALSNCSRNGFVGGVGYTNQWNIFIATGDVTTPKSWLGTGVYQTGYIIDGTDAQQQCSTMIGPALTLWGYSSGDYENFIQSVGYTLQKEQNCTGTTSYDQSCKATGNQTYGIDTSSSKVVSNFQTTIKNNNYGALAPNISKNPGLMYFRAQVNIELPAACNAKPYKKVSDLTADEKKLYTNNDGIPQPAATNNNGNPYGSSTTWSPNKDYLIVHLVNGTTWGKEDWVYKIAKADWSKAIPLAENPAGGSPDISTCVGLAKNTYGWANSIVADAATMIAANKDPATKYGSYITTPGQGAVLGADSSQNTNPDGKSSCVIEGIGWIICPVITFMANIADGAFGFLADNFLRTDPQVLNTSADNGTFTAWSIMRTVANVVFVIIFLIIIFSQLTSVGVSNYGVKKMLPRLIIAAILVNLSFFVSQLAVDISNILGYSIKDVFNGITNKVANTTSLDTLAASPFNTGKGGFATIAGTVIATTIVGVAGYAMLSTLIPILLAAVIALIMILFILVARQAIIILLIVISPLAFVAFLLPNTEKLFTQWRKMLTAMLLLFPIIALVFGASQLASQILTDAQVYKASASGGGDLFGQVIAAAILVLPLFVVPVLLKKSLDGIPVLGQMAGKLASRANGNLGKKVKESNTGSLLGRSRAYKKAGQEAYRGRSFANRITKGGLAGALARGISVTPAGIAGQDSLIKSATAASLKAENEELEAAKGVFVNSNISGKERHDLATKGSVTIKRDGKPDQVLSGDVMQRAAIQEQMRVGSYGEQAEIIASSAKGRDLEKFSQSIANGVAQNGLAGKDPALAGKRVDEISQGKFDQESAVKAAIGEGKYTAEAFATMNDDARATAIAIAREKATNPTDPDPSYLEALQRAAQGIRDSAEISGKLNNSAKAVAQLNGLIGAPPAAGAPTLNVPHT